MGPLQSSQFLSMPGWSIFVIYALSFAISLLVLAAVDWTKMIRYEKKAFGILIYIMLSIALAYLVGSFILQISSINWSIV